MNQRTKQRTLQSRLNGSPLATVCFLLIAAAVVCCCVLLVGRMAKRELGANDGGRQKDAQTEAAPTPTQAEAARTPEARMAAAVYTPHIPTPTPLPAATVPPETPAPTASPTPAPTLLPARDAPEPDDGGLDLVLIGTDEQGRADLIAVVRVRPDGCRVLCVPRNTVSVSGMPLSDASSPARAARLLTGVFPVRLPHTATVRMDGLAACIDRFGGVTIDGMRMTGAETQAYLDQGPSDELLRIARQQTVMRAYLHTLRETGVLTLLSAKLALEPYLDSDIPLSKLLALYTLLRELPDEALSFSILPVDSVSADGARYYTPDVARVNALAEAFMQ